MSKPPVPTPSLPPVLPAVDTVAVGPLTACPGSHAWRYQYGADIDVMQGGPGRIERFTCTTCLAMIDVLRPPRRDRP